MKRWTDDNTEGFTDDELDLLNEAQDILEDRNPDIHHSNICDALNNAWRSGITLEELLNAI